MLDVKTSLMRKINDRRETLNIIFNRIESLVRAGKIGDEANRVWAENFILQEYGKDAVGLDLFCGDFKFMSTALGVDGNCMTVGPDFILGDGFLPVVIPDSQDYIFTNYFECVHEPLKILNEWRRVLKPKGVLVLVVRDANTSYVLQNAKRVSAFTQVTMRQYLKRAGYTNIQMSEGSDNAFRVVAYK